MTNVFFKGFGSWYAWGKEGAQVIVPSYGANGVFSLNDSDTITYKHTGSLPLNVSMLHPTSHPDSEFLRLKNIGKTFKMFGFGEIDKYTEDECFFVMDDEQPKDKILVIASPYQAMPDAEAVEIGGVGKNESEATKSWKKVAWEIGESWMKEQREGGKDPGVIDIAKYVEGEMSNKGLVGARGKFLDFETIKREALTGITGKPANGKGKIKRKQAGESPV
jgi:hypothetical protein